MLVINLSMRNVSIKLKKVKHFSVTLLLFTPAATP